MELKAIAHMRSVFPEKFGIPRQSGLVEELESRIVFEKEYAIAEAFRGLEEYSHIWIIITDAIIIFSIEFFCALIRYD